tara:strand:+ start:312 stop:737 length:426 start_codon:yes stop_codon:yes gene_type:complete
MREKKKARGIHIPWSVKQKVLEDKVNILDARFKQSLITFQMVIHSVIERNKDSELKPILEAALNDKIYRSDALVRKMIKDKTVVGECNLCSINCYGTEAMPRKMSFPCGLVRCPYERKNTRPIKKEDALETLLQVKRDYYD